MWPLFMEAWGPWRAARLGLPPLPGTDAAGDPLPKLPLAPLLLYGAARIRQLYVYEWAAYAAHEHFPTTRQHHSRQSDDIPAVPSYTASIHPNNCCFVLLYIL